VYKNDVVEETITLDGELEEYTIPVELNPTAVYRFTVAYLGQHLALSEAQSLGPFTVTESSGTILQVDEVVEETQQISDVLVLDNGTTTYLGTRNVGTNTRAMMVALASNDTVVYSKEYDSPLDGENAPIGSVTTDGSTVFYSRQSGAATHITAINTAGDVLWSKELSIPTSSETFVTGMTFGNGNLYVSVQHLDSNWAGVVVRLSDTGVFVSARNYTPAMANENKPWALCDVGDGIVMMAMNAGNPTWCKYTYDLATMVFHRSYPDSANLTRFDGVNSIVYSGGDVVFTTPQKRTAFYVNATTGVLSKIERVGEVGNNLSAVIDNGASGVYYYLTTPGLSLFPTLMKKSSSGQTDWVVRFNQEAVGIPTERFGTPITVKGDKVHAALLGGGAAYATRFPVGTIPNTIPNNVDLSFADVTVTVADISIAATTAQPLDTGTAATVTTSDITVTETPIIGVSQYEF
jgi:hypothetical protein